MIATESTPQRFLAERSGYRIVPHANHARLYHIVPSTTALAAFFAAVRDINAQRLEYVPYMRFVVAQRLETALGTSLLDDVRSIVRDRESGGFTIGLEGTTTDADDYVKFATAVSYLLGPSNFDAMSGTFYARFEVKHTDESDSYLRQAYRTMTLHTDGTYVDEQTDWLLMMKFAEQHAVGGETRILHLDDWDALREFSEHALATHVFTYKSPPSKNVGLVMHRPTFFHVDSRPCISYIDQFVYPETIAEGMFLDAMTESMEGAHGTVAVPLPVGDLIVLNNLFWLHGRAAFEVDPQLHRELLRQRGYFSP